jgi:hypothetical protein
MARCETWIPGEHSSSTTSGLGVVRVVVAVGAVVDKVRGQAGVRFPHPLPLTSEMRLWSCWREYRLTPRKDCPNMAWHARSWRAVAVVVVVVRCPEGARLAPPSTRPPQSSVLGFPRLSASSVVMKDGPMSSNPDTFRCVHAPRSDLAETSSEYEHHEVVKGKASEDRSPRTQSPSCKKAETKVKGERS